MQELRAGVRFLAPFLGSAICYRRGRPRRRQGAPARRSRRKRARTAPPCGAQPWPLVSMYRYSHALPPSRCVRRSNRGLNRGLPRSRRVLILQPCIMTCPAGFAALNVKGGGVGVGVGVGVGGDCAGERSVSNSPAKRFVADQMPTDQERSDPGARALLSGFQPARWARRARAAQWL